MPFDNFFVPIKPTKSYFYYLCGLIGRTVNDDCHNHYGCAHTA